ncbi:mitochondrial import receptor subunit TOM34 isoform 1-T3 [Polymixia lowei]
MPHKRRSQSWVELKQAGNERFKTGQYGEAAELYSRAIKELEKSGKKSPEDLSILYSNRAASYLKDGNCGECVKDCNASLELVPFGIKSLLRRAAAHEALERYRLAYVDYKTALHVDCNIPAARDGTNRMTKVLSDMDGPSWREKLPALPTVSLAVREKMVQQARQTAGPQVPTQHNGNTHTPAPSEQDIRRGQVLKEEGNALVKKGQHQKAIERYSQSLKHNPTEVTTYTNRALCYLSVKQYRAAVRDCDAALLIDTSNIKALYRRSQAHRELKDITSCVEDLNSLLEVEPKNSAALKLLQEVQKKK